MASNISPVVIAQWIQTIIAVIENLLNPTPVPPTPTPTPTPVPPVPTPTP